MFNLSEEHQFRYLLLETDPRQRKLARQIATRGLSKQNEDTLAADENGETFVAIVNWLLANSPTPIAAWEFCKYAEKFIPDNARRRWLATGKENDIRAAASTALWQEAQEIRTMEATQHPEPKKDRPTRDKGFLRKLFGG